MILVTGATGNIGPGVVRALKGADLPARAAIHKTPLEMEGVETCPLDFDDPATFAPALRGIDALFLLSADVAHEARLVDAARTAGVARIAYLSAFGAETDDFLAGRMHREIEQRIEASGMAWTFLSPNFLMQNFISVMGEDIRREDAFYDSIGDARVSMFDARDLGPVTVRVLTEPGHEGRAYELSGPEAIGHNDAAAILSEALGRKIRYVQIDDDAYRQRLTEAGLPPHDVDALVDVNREAREGRTDDHVVTDTVRRLIGRTPTSFADFCHDHAAAFAPARIRASGAG
jgi:uncharacterized protein YbjT (DUF2867 family)